MQLLSDSEAECRQFAADCITSMAPDGRHLYHPLAVLVLLYTSLLPPPPTHILSPLLPSESLRSELITAGAVPSLVSSLSFPLSLVQTSAAEALSLLACDTTARDQVRGSKREGGGGGGGPNTEQISLAIIVGESETVDSFLSL